MNARSYQIGLVVLLVGITTGCIDPVDRRPGLRLSGEVVSEAIQDWSFSDEFQEIYLETRTWYMIPHSVTTVCAAVGDKLYIPTIYFEGGQWPDKYWNSNVDSDPYVRLEMGGKIYNREAKLLEDPHEIDVALAALVAKYPFWRDVLSKPENQRPDMALLRMDARNKE